MVLGVPSAGIAKSLLVGRVVTGRGDPARVVHGGRTVGFAVETDGVARYWSAGYSVGLRELRFVIQMYARVCLQAMSEADREARERVRSA